MCACMHACVVCLCEYQLPACVCVCGHSLSILKARATSLLPCPPDLGALVHSCHRQSLRGPSRHEATYLAENLVLLAVWEVRIQEWHPKIVSEKPWVQLHIGLFSPLAWKAILPIFGNPSILKGRDSEGPYSAKGNNAIFF